MHWYEDDELWSGFAEVLFTPERAARAARAVDTSPLLRFAPHARVLDQCCGTGTFTVPLARRGNQVTGVDLSPVMLARARRACDEAGIEAELVQADMRDFVRPAAFDVVVNLYTSFGYFDTNEQNLRALRNAHDSLRPGGVLVMDLLGKEHYAKWAGTPKVVEVSNGRVFMHDTIIENWTRFRTEWTLIRDGVVRQASLTQFIYSGAELMGLFNAAGFVDVQCFGDFDGRPYDNHATRLIVRGSRAA
jgi:SAM-dependent methyltransferase